MTDHTEDNPIFSVTTKKTTEKPPSSQQVTPSRRQIAAMVLQGIVSGEDGETRENLRKSLVEEAVLLTDLLLKELEKTP